MISSIQNSRDYWNIWAYSASLTPRKYGDSAIPTADISGDAELAPNDTPKRSRSTDRMTISPQASSLAALDKSNESNKSTEAKPVNPQEIKPNGEPLTDEEERKVEKLRQRDRKVRAHEQAHLSAAGGLAVGGANYEYETGPDGKQYAVGGEVKLRIPDGATPEEDLRIALQVERAALAPADPSPQDRATAAKARHKAGEARLEITENNTEKMQKNGDNTKVAEAKEAGNAMRKENDVEQTTSIQSDYPHIRYNDKITSGSDFDFNQGIIFDRGKNHNVDMII